VLRNQKAVEEKPPLGWSVALGLSY